ncbi:putative lipid II flippase FtsW [Methylicorpusculum oleiharenae]|uniref:putative lipid II flippase FtsW n=1 Tax=Methylicorpusculum oleiharenae TaxID=1338687 RepID=UPI00135A2996|nr:putative lipid II flippase FtsW [Methylicorpusculum oleiharenae]MCD2449049.1 putative lipid II flippase FtsW [Methylicorpusculum oleiharenae]
MSASDSNKPGKEFYLDYQVIGISCALLIIGFIMVSSASFHLGEKMQSSNWHYPMMQMIHIVIGLVFAVAMYCVPLSFWERYGQWLFLGGLALLLLVFVPGLGVKVNGSTRWISLGGFRIQVSEVVKLISVIYMASYVTRYQDTLRNSTFGAFKPLALFVVASVLLLLEPDFGSAVVIVSMAMVIMFLSGARLGQFAALLLIFGSAAAALVIISPYRWKRIVSYLNPWADPENTGFQLVQALISFGRGEWIGVGLGNSLQKLFYLPEAHTDFLFSVLAEELGLLGITLVILLFALLVWRAFKIGVTAENAGLAFPAYVAYGIGFWFGFQAFINMGVNMGILPTKGITLPLMSYGGGSMIVMCSAIALLLRVSSDAHVLKASLPKGNPLWANA